MRDDVTTILNSPVLTEYGDYSYRPLTLDEARQLVREGPWRSAVGHEATARIISEALGIDCPANRVQHRQGAGECSLIFRLRSRPPEGKVLSGEEIDAIGGEWGLLCRTA